MKMVLNLVIKEDAMHTCHYCMTETRKHEFSSEFFHEFHYKVMECPACREKLWTNVDFMGTGHDAWSHKQRRLIDLKTTEERVAFMKLHDWIDFQVINH